MKQNKIVLVMLLTLGFLFFSTTSCSDINTVGDNNFTSDGVLIVTDSLEEDSFNMIPPAKIKYYIESSGSMNGFFRPNQPTHFKSDIWEIMNYYSAAIPTDITVLTNDGSTGAQISLNNFQTLMNCGISSMFVLRMKSPNGYLRGSSFVACTLSASLLTFMVRNL